MAEKIYQEDMVYIENYVKSINEHPNQKYINVLKNDVMALLKNRTVEMGENQINN